MRHFKVRESPRPEPRLQGIIRPMRPGWLLAILILEEVRW